VTVLSLQGLGYVVAGVVFAVMVHRPHAAPEPAAPAERSQYV
jgi:hypothetical protein